MNNPSTLRWNVTVDDFLGGRFVWVKISHGWYMGGCFVWVEMSLGRYMGGRIVKAPNQGSNTCLARNVTSVLKSGKKKGSESSETDHGIA
jgi:hypothetical protein